MGGELKVDSRPARAAASSSTCRSYRPTPRDRRVGRELAAPPLDARLAEAKTCRRSSPTTARSTAASWRAARERRRAGDHAAGGLEAIALARKHCPNVIFMD
jgi:hypothetical protein